MESQQYAEGFIAGLLRIDANRYARGSQARCEWIYGYFRAVSERGARYTGPLRPLKPDWVQLEADKLRERRRLEEMAGG